MFDYDWFHGPGYEQQKQEARWRCTLQHFPDMNPDVAGEDANVRKMHEELEERTLVYLRDGFSYEVKGIADLEAKSHLVFECEPVDDHYKVGAFVVSIPFEEIVRVEVFAVHPSEKPEDLPQITGFRAGPDPAEPHKLGEMKTPTTPGKPTTPPR